MRKQYRRRANHDVVAVQLALDTEGFRYRKWGAEQHCKAGDWLVNNGGDTYTVDHDTFARTYSEVAPGQFRKTALVWAEQKAAAGAVNTREGTTHYAAGDYLVSNDEAWHDVYAVSAQKFAEMYEPVD
jgi:hypothetical protein